MRTIRTKIIIFSESSNISGSSYSVDTMYLAAESNVFKLNATDNRGNIYVASFIENIIYKIKINIYKDLGGQKRSVRHQLSPPLF